MSPFIDSTELNHPNPNSNLPHLQASSPIQQLELITDLLGTPSAADMKYACDAARRHMLQRGSKPNNLGALYTLGSSATHEAVHLLCQVNRHFYNLDSETQKL